jgi:hypothetical protein
MTTRRKRTGIRPEPTQATRRVARAAGRVPGAAAVILAAIATVGVAHAGGEGSARPGTLGQVTSAVRSDMDAHAPAGGGAAQPGEHGHVSQGYYDSYHCPTCPPFVAGSVPGGPGMRGPAAPLRVSLALGLQAVEGSDAAVSGAARVHLGGLGLALEGTQYFERDRTGGGETIFMDIWSMRLAGRVLRLGHGELWVEGGMAGTGSSGFERVTGTVIGAGVVHAPSPTITLRGGARYYVFERDLHATEAHADIGVSFLSVGYRVLAFGVGPALHGPGFGVQAEF